MGKNGKLGRVLVVDDDSMMCALYQTVLSSEFEVTVAHSGKEALAQVAQAMPDLILLDIEMPDMNGYEVCKKVRETSNVPVIFVTAHQSMDEHLKAYNAGANDIVTKPIDVQILQRKVSVSLDNYFQQLKLKQAKDKLELHFFSTMGESGILLNFIRAGLGCRSFSCLAEKLIEAAREFGIECGVLIRTGGDNVVLTTHGEPTSLELSILEQSSSMGREFRFKNRLVVNHERVSILVSNLPEEEERAQQIRDSLITLAETAEALVETVELRKESNERAEKMQLAMGNSIAAIENFRSKNKAIMMDTCVLLQDLVRNVESCYSWLDTSKEQEIGISNVMNESVQRILNLLSQGSETEKDLEKILQVMHGDQGGSVDDMLF